MLLHTHNLLEICSVIAKGYFFNNLIITVVYSVIWAI